jgi:predicted phosphohydrolase
MSLYAIGDLHLSITTNKPMSIFGPAWENHAEKLQRAFSALSGDDVTVLCGDISWGMDLEQSLADFKFVDALPGKKIILKGNHDYWWNTVTKIKKFFAENGITTIEILNNNSYIYSGTAAICGTRGWFFEEETGSEHDRKILERELGRLKASLESAGDVEKYVFLHYPPKYGTYECPEILEILRNYNARTCIYGHLHGKSLKHIFEGELDGTAFRCVSADNVDFMPQRILD